MEGPAETNKLLHRFRKAVYYVPWKEKETSTDPNILDEESRRAWLSRSKHRENQIQKEMSRTSREDTKSSKKGRQKVQGFLQLHLQITLGTKTKLCTSGKDSGSTRGHSPR